MEEDDKASVTTGAAAAGAARRFFSSLVSSATAFEEVTPTLSGRLPSPSSSSVDSIVEGSPLSAQIVDDQISLLIRQYFSVLEPPPVSESTVRNVVSAVLGVVRREAKKKSSKPKSHLPGGPFSGLLLRPSSTEEDESAAAAPMSMVTRMRAAKALSLIFKFKCNVDSFRAMIMEEYEEGLRRARDDNEVLKRDVDFVFECLGARTS